MEAILKSITRQPEGSPLQQIIDTTQEGQEVRVVFPPAEEQPEPEVVRLTGDLMRTGHTYVFEVKKYMMEKTRSADFDFMAAWNNNVPMPFKIMVGVVLKETRGMLYMSCRAYPVKTTRCIKCGKPLTHPISMLYGLGPECGSHFYKKPPMTEDEYKKEIDSITEKLNEVTWEGWVIKKAVEKAMEV